MEKKEQYAPTFIDGYGRKETLSDKRFDGLQCSCCDKKLRNKFFSYREDDVKEFIRDLKEELNERQHIELAESIDSDAIIDKLAGDKL